MSEFTRYRQSNGELYAWLCIDQEELNQEVPSHFPLSSNRTWSTYSSLTYLPNGLIFIIVGEHDMDGNRKDIICDDEFQLWLDHFVGRNFWNLEEAREYMKQFESTEI